MKRRFCILALLAVAVVLCIPLVTDGHSPYQPRVEFFHPVFPDRPIADFANGRLGVLQPEWSLGYRVVFYRYLTARPLSPVERSSFLTHRELHPDSALQPVRNEGWTGVETGPPQQWVRARAQYRKDKPPAGSPDDWWSYTAGDDCLADSFRTAIWTLHDRAKRYGQHSRELQDWITAQDQVYQNCSWEYGRRPTNGMIPAELPASAPALARADRAYQIAAAHFYAANTNEAIRRFHAIAADPASPWQEVAVYLVARVNFRSTFPSDLAQADPKLLAQADASLQAAAAQITDRRLKSSVAGLREYIALRLNPDAEYRLLARRISEGTGGDRFGQDIIDLEYLIDRVIGDSPDFSGVNEWTQEYRTKLAQWRDQRYSEIRTQRIASDLTDWVLTVQWNTPTAARHAVERWQKDKSLPWLVAALVAVHGNDKAAGSLIEAAAHVAADSPAYPTVALHRARLLRERGEIANAREVLDEGLQHSESCPVSAINLFKQERLLVADSAAEFARLLPQQPVGFTNGSVTKAETEYCTNTGWSVACEKDLFEESKPHRLLPQIDDQTARLLDQNATLEFLISIANDSSLPQNLRREFAPAVWARAAVLDRQTEAASIATLASQMRPELKPYIDEYHKAQTAEERKFLAAYAIVHFPGLRPAVNGSTPRVTRFDYADNFRDNWWCSDGLPREFLWESDYEPPPAPLPQLAIFSAAERARAASEFHQIVALGPAGDWLADTLIEWAKAHPSDSRSAEALHFAWRAIRFACDGKKNRSREVYILLHKRYPKSVWTKKTRVWW